jgi:monooxygenase
VPSSGEIVQPTQSTHFDVLVVGAGISGISAAYHLQKNLPNKTYAILEGRERMGGTWDLFKYPGIRSDSDMYTLGFSFRPWTKPKAIADGASILEYLRETAEAFGIDRHIRYRQRVDGARWSSKDSKWTIEVTDTASGATVPYTCSFLYVCAGYYDYEAGYTPEFAGRDRFRGRVVHPQHWPSDMAIEGKRIVVIGSGATAVTLVPELAKRGGKVTMLQRSPTYIVSMPAKDPIANWMRTRLSPDNAYAATRWKNVALSMAFYQFCRRFPARAKKMLVEQVRRQLDGKASVENDFTPSYNPWDQRLCLVPNGDLFRAIRKEQVSVVTDHIETFTETGIQLRSGRTLDADLIVTATGLKLKLLGGIDVDVDGQRMSGPERMLYKAMMVSDVPNLAFAVGYTNASWTLKCDLTSEYMCRLLQHMDKRGFTKCVPRRDPSVTEEPTLNFSSGYIQRSIADWPKQGSVAPWRLYQNYALDRVTLRHGRIDDPALSFS